jgi:hypothetical protein
MYQQKLPTLKINREREKEREREREFQELWKKYKRYNMRLGNTRRKKEKQKKYFK